MPNVGRYDMRDDQMLFEKKKNWDSNALVDIAGYTMLVVAVASVITYGLTTLLWKSNSTTPFDIINAVAQVTTAATLALLVRQHISNNRVARQREICSEAKQQIASMVACVRSIKVGEEVVISNLDRSVTVLTNLAVNFEALFDAMDEDVNKGLVRMHWQDMFFNHLWPVLESIELYPLLKNERNIDSEHLALLMINVGSAAAVTVAPSPLKTFVKYELLLNDPYIAGHFSLKENIGSLDMFVYYYLTTARLNDHLYGVFNRPEPRKIAPLFMAAKPADLYSLERSKYIS